MSFFFLIFIFEIIRTGQLPRRAGKEALVSCAVRLLLLLMTREKKERTKGIIAQGPVKQQPNGSESPRRNLSSFGVPLDLSSRIFFVFTFLLGLDRLFTPVYGVGW